MPSVKHIGADVHQLEKFGVGIIHRAVHDFRNPQAVDQHGFVGAGRRNGNFHLPLNAEIETDIRTGQIRLVQFGHKPI